MDLLVQALLDAAIAMGKYLATLPEQDREKVVAQWKAQAAQTAVDVTALSDELTRVKAEHEALKAQMAAAQQALAPKP